MVKQRAKSLDSFLPLQLIMVQVFDIQQKKVAMFHLPVKDSLC